MGFRRILAVALLLAGLGLSLLYLPVPPTLQTDEILLKAKFSGCTCPDMNVLDGIERLKAANRHPEITAYHQIFLEGPVNQLFDFMRDGSGESYWIAGKLSGHRGLDGESWIYPVFSIRAQSYASLQLEGAIGIGLGGLGLLILIYPFAARRRKHTQEDPAR